MSGRLTQFFREHTGLETLKWSHYLTLYERYLNRFLGQMPRLLEIGVRHGGSLEMWNYYFHQDCFLIGIDILPICQSLDRNNIQIIIGDQGNRAFWQQFKQSQPPLDIIIDDGGHQMEQQIITFEELWPHLKPGGLYVVEDVHSSYLKNQFPGTGHRQPGTFMEYVKGLGDQIQAFFSQDESLPVTDYTRTIEGIYIHDSLIVIEKSLVERTKPHKIRAGLQKLF